MNKMFGAVLGVAFFSAFAVVGGFAVKNLVADRVDTEEYDAGVIYDGRTAPNGDPIPSADCDDWNLRLVNHSNYLPGDFSISLTDVGNNRQVDSRCASALENMLADCRSAGCDPLICSAYRTQECQQRLFDNEVSKYMNCGYEYEEAYNLAAEGVAIPGTSEHQLGLAVDIVDCNNQNLNETQEDTPTQRWLFENCWRYGFILRYAADKVDITGYKYEPWHYRYVGEEAAQFIYEHDICLEEYLGKSDESAFASASHNENKSTDDSGSNHIWSIIFPGSDKDEEYDYDEDYENNENYEEATVIYYG